MDKSACVADDVIIHCVEQLIQTMKTASATIKGSEVMLMIRRGHCLMCKPQVKEEVGFINKLFDVFTSAA